MGNKNIKLHSNLMPKLPESKTLENVQTITFANRHGLIMNLEPEGNKVEVDLQTKPSLVTFENKGIIMTIPLSQIKQMIRSK
jgi:hypothetical protein